MSQNTGVDSLNVFCNLRGTKYFVGKLAERNRTILFEYDKDFLASGIELSPFKLPLRPGVFEDKERVFDGLPGVFNDSLPDGWGLLLLDRALRGQGTRLHEISPLQRLSMVGSGGMGAMEYVPSQEARANLNPAVLQLDGLAEESRNILAEGDSSLEVVFDLLKLGGSSGGARPKILADVSADGSKVIPDGAGGEGFSPWLPETELAPLQREMWRLVAQAQKRGAMSMTANALALWESIYPELSQENTGLAGSIINRAEAQTLRLALIYALLDGQSGIDETHLKAALTMWRYAQESALYIFGDRAADPLEEKILEILRQGPLAATELSAALNRNIPKDRLQPLLQQLEAQRRISVTHIKQNGRGRPRLVFALREINAVNEENENNESNEEKSVRP